MPACNNCGTEHRILYRANRKGIAGLWLCPECCVETQRARYELRQMPEHELASVSFEVLKWQCSVEGCCRFTRIKDYSCSPFYHWRKGWIDLSQNIFYCAKHWQYFKRVPERLKYKPGPGEDHIISN